MTVESTIRIYEVNGADLPTWSDLKFRVRSHRVYRDWVVLVTPDGQAFTVTARELEAAVANAHNWRG